MTDNQSPAPAVPKIDYHPGAWYEVKTHEELEAFFLSRLPSIREAAREPGNAIDDDWNEHPKIHKNPPLYTAPPAAPALVALTDERIEQIAHRMCWKYKHSTDPNHSHTYKFNRTTLIDFVRQGIGADGGEGK